MRTPSKTWKYYLEAIVGPLALLLVVAMIAAGFNILKFLALRLWNGVWDYWSVGDFGSYIGLPIIGKMAAWPFSVVVLLAGFAVIGLVSEMDNSDLQTRTNDSVETKPNYPLKLPKFFWPNQIKAETTALLRLGRTIHWLSVVVAVVTILVAIAIGWTSISDAASSEERLRVWELSRQYGLKTEGYLDEDRPYVYESYFWLSVFLGLLAAFVVAMVGRAIRYIFGGE